MTIRTFLPVGTTKSTETVADQVNDASPQAIAALKQEYNKLIKENEDCMKKWHLRVVILVSSLIAIVVIYSCSVN